MVIQSAEKLGFRGYRDTKGTFTLYLFYKRNLSMFKRVIRKFFFSVVPFVSISNAFISIPLFCRSTMKRKQNYKERATIMHTHKTENYFAENYTVNKDEKQQIRLSY